jgi:hypothetical protein
MQMFVTQYMLAMPNLHQNSSVGAFRNTAERGMLRLL